MCAIKATFMAPLPKFGWDGFFFEAKSFEITSNFSPFIFILPGRETAGLAVSGMERGTRWDFGSVGWSR